MRNIIKLEEMAMLVASIFALIYLKVEWWYYLILFLGPDISIIGYLAGNKLGAICYNIFHHKGIALTLLVIGFVYHNWALQVTGLVLFGHSSLDRMAGYGLKLMEGFKFTHLGSLEKNK